MTFLGSIHYSFRSAYMVLYGRSFAKGVENGGRDLSHRPGVKKLWSHYKIVVSSCQLL